MGQGPNVIYDIVKKANIPKGSHIYMDNLFTSFPLLNNGDGNRRYTHNETKSTEQCVPIMNKKDLEKKLFLEEAMHVFNRI